MRGSRSDQKMTRMDITGGGNILQVLVDLATIEEMGLKEVENIDDVIITMIVDDANQFEVLETAKMVIEGDQSLREVLPLILLQSTMKLVITMEKSEI